MLLIYPLGIPLTFGYLLFVRHRRSLEELRRRELRAAAHEQLKQLSTESSGDVAKRVKKAKLSEAMQERSKLRKELERLERTRRRSCSGERSRRASLSGERRESCGGNERLGPLGADDAAEESPSPSKVVDTEKLDADIDHVASKLDAFDGHVRALRKQLGEDVEEHGGERRRRGSEDFQATTRDANAESDSDASFSHGRRRLSFLPSVSNGPRKSKAGPKVSPMPCLAPDPPPSPPGSVDDSPAQPPAVPSDAPPALLSAHREPPELPRTVSGQRAPLPKRQSKSRRQQRAPPNIEDAEKRDVHKSTRKPESTPPAGLRRGLTRSLTRTASFMGFGTTSHEGARKRSIVSVLRGKARVAGQVTVRTAALHEDTTTVQGVRKLAKSGRLPEHVQKLIEGYDLRCYWFELFECGRKIALVGMPVFFDMGSVAQLAYGLLVCFISFGAFTLLKPYADDSDDRLAQLCQVQVFFALIASIVLRWSDDTTYLSTYNMDAILILFTFLPIVFAFLVHAQEEGLVEYFRETFFDPLRVILLPYAIRARAAFRGA